MFKLFTKKAPAFDVAEGNAVVPQGLALLQAGNGAALGALYAGLPAADRVHFLDGLGLLSDIGAALPPHDQHPALAAVEGGLRYVWAHRLRGFATADQTSDAQAFDMYDMADAAHAALAEAAEITPADSAVHAFRIRAEMLARGVDGGVDEIVRALDAAGEPNVLASLARLNYLAPKWHGSVEEMHAFADADTARPPNASFLGLKARAHIEEWLYETAMNDAPGAAEAFKQRSATPEFRQALADLDDRFLDVVKSGAALSAAEMHFARNQFAVLFVAFTSRDRLKRHLGELAAPSAAPWGYFAGKDVPGFLARLRRELGLPKR
ncbi:MAG: hypothetical protein Q8S09_09965 [Hyphomonas sp.]|nr:hypothetical protein [Hyphomonas sp.]